MENKPIVLFTTRKNSNKCRWVRRLTGESISDVAVYTRHFVITVDRNYTFKEFSKDYNIIHVSSLGPGEHPGEVVRKYFSRDYNKFYWPSRYLLMINLTNHLTTIGDKVNE